MRKSWAWRSLVSALVLVACGCSGSGTGSPGSGGGGAGATAGSGGVGGRGATGGFGTAGSSGGSGAAGMATGGSGAAGTGAGGSGAAGTGAAGTGAGGAAPGGSGGGASCLSPVSHDIDLMPTSLSGEITVQGATGATGSATLELRTAAGDRALLATITSGGSIIQLVLPGTYDVYYRLTKAAPGLPVNQRAKVQSGVVIAPVAQTLDVTVGATPVSVALTSNGSTTPGFAGDSIHLRTADGDDAPLGTSATLVVPGTYDVYYVRPSFSSGPINGSAKLQSGYVVGASAQTLSIDVPRTTISGTLTLNGSKTPPTGATATAYGLGLRNAAGDGGSIASQLGTYTASVIPGTYDLYGFVAPGAAGLNSYPSFLLQKGIVVGSSPLTLNVDIPTTTVSGTITVNGAQRLASSDGLGKLTFQNATDTWTFAPTSPPYASTAGGAYSAAIVPGTYDLYYGVITAGKGVPSNTSVKLRSGVVIGTTSPQTLDIDIPATTVTGTITVNGAQVDASMGNGGLHLRNAAGDDALIGTTSVAGAYAQLVVAGTYDLTYEFITGGDGVPYNQLAKLRSGIAVGSTPLTLDIDVAASMVSGAITQLGQSISGRPGEIGNLTLQAPTGDKAVIGSTFSATYSRHVIAGTYELMYGAQVVSFGIPTNTLADLGCYGVP